MSRKTTKWNPFSRKKTHNKTDSHGTTLANEEMFFQPSVRAGNKWCTTINPNNEQEVKLNSIVNESQQEKMKSGATGAAITEKMISETNAASNTPSNNNASFDESQILHHKSELSKASHIPVPSKPVVPDPQNLSAASVPRTSPRIARKLIKPGASADEQQSYLIPTTNGNTVSNEVMILKMK